ncbi:MFS drug transporter [Aspergillus californicus]
MADQKTSPDITNVTTTNSPLRESPSGASTTESPSNPPLDPLNILEIEDPTPRSKRRTTGILVALFLVLFTTALDQTITATSIPVITSSLHSAAGYTWIGSAYLLANAFSGPIWARLSDIFGRKPALLSSVSLFGIASILAATSSSMRMLIAARALQGVASGGIGGLVYITISDLFSMRRRALVFGSLGGVWAVAGCTGPVLGGALTGLGTSGMAEGWRWCFWINVPICTLALILISFLLDVHNPRTDIRKGLAALDWPGTLSIISVTLLLLLGLEFGGTVFPWNSAQVLSLLILGSIMVLFFIFSEKRLARYPLIPMTLFTQRATLAAFTVAFAHGMVSFGVEYYLPLYFQSVRQASPLRSGILVLPMMVTEASTDILAGVYLHRVGRYREITWVGVVLMTLGTGLYILVTRTTAVGPIIAIQITSGIGVALLFQTPVLAIQNTVAQGETAAATATVGFMRNLATSFSIVVGGVVFRHGMDGQQGFLAGMGIPEDVLGLLTGENAAANVGVVKGLEDPVQRAAVQDAFSGSLRNMFIFYTAVAAVGLVGGGFITQREMSREHVETKTGVDMLKEREG